MAGAVATFGVISATSHLVGLSVRQARFPPSFVPISYSIKRRIGRESPRFYDQQT